MAELAWNLDRRLRLDPDRINNRVGNFGDFPAVQSDENQSTPEHLGEVKLQGT